VSRRIFILAGLLAGLIFTACEVAHQPSNAFPSDYFFAQRAFPYNRIDNEALSNAQKWRLLKLASPGIEKHGKWQQEGPFNMDGRVTDIEIHPQNDSLIYVGTASGGVFVTENAGESWTPLFDDEVHLSIGDIAIHAVQPEILYVGTGESNAGGGSLAYDGNGVYSTDQGGQSWTHRGLEDVGSIGRIVIDPADPDIVFVAAMGHLFDNNDDRGVYRSFNGGEEWERVLFVSDSTGAIDLAIHPHNGQILYAAMWERIRRPHNRQYGGHTSGIYKSVDGGTTWAELTNGLPAGPEEKGRIGLAISQSSPEVVYAYYAQWDGPLQGIYKTEDGGDTWRALPVAGISDVPYMWWFGRIYVHPSDPDRLYATSIYMHASEDGGESWQTIFPGSHVDHHAMAFSLQDDDLIFNGNDGGVYMSHDNGQSIHNYLYGLGNFQFYSCTIDPVSPEVIYGGAQDNGVVIRREGQTAWEMIQGGDGFRILIDPDDNQQIYFSIQNGSLFASSDAGETRRFAGIGLTGRANWNAPLAMDPHNPEILYTGTQFIFRSTDRAESWEKISESLVNTDNPPGNISFGTLTSLVVSDHDPDVIYAGTDDGNVWITKDAGTTFNNISEGLPKRWITSIAVDPWLESGVYLGLSGFRWGESSAQLYYSSDFGQSWIPMAEEMPDVPVNDIIVDDQERGYIYLATDVGVYYQEEAGREWQLFGTGLPNVPVTDLDYNSTSRILAAASYGRGIFTHPMPVSTNVQEPNEAIALRIWPNPASSVIHIHADARPENIVLRDLGGKILAESQMPELVIPSQLPHGVYLVEITFKGTSLIRKCIIN